MVVTPESYDAVLEELRQNHGRLSSRTRESLALEAFALTARYDTAISRWFAEREEDFPAQYTRSYEKVLDLPYGENPHQRAAYYSEVGARTHLMSMVSKLHGRELTFNNLLDLDAGRRLVDDFELPAAVIIKHNNPCGAAIAAGAEQAFEQARWPPIRRAPTAGIYCFNRRDRPRAGREAARPVRGGDLRAGLRRGRARGARAEAERAAAREPGAAPHPGRPSTTSKRVRGGMLVQDRDTGLEEREEMDVVTRRKPTEGEWGEMLFAMRVCKHVRSNAIVLVDAGSGPPAIGAGQMSRVDSVRLAVDKAADAGIDLVGAVMASDAFFPFADGAQLGDRGGRASDHSAGRLAARRRGDRRLRRSGRGDGLHGPPPLPSLAR